MNREENSLFQDCDEFARPAHPESEENRRVEPGSLRELRCLKLGHRISRRSRAANLLPELCWMVATRNGSVFPGEKFRGGPPGELAVPQEACSPEFDATTPSAWHDTCCGLPAMLPDQRATACRISRDPR